MRLPVRTLKATPRRPRLHSGGHACACACVGMCQGGAAGRGRESLVASTALLLPESLFLLRPSPTFICSRTNQGPFALNPIIRFAKRSTSRACLPSNKPHLVRSLAPNHRRLSQSLQLAPHCTTPPTSSHTTSPIETPSVTSYGPYPLAFPRSHPDAICRYPLEPI